MCGSSIIKNRPQLYLITVLLTIFFILVSTPWSFGLSYYADSKAAWVFYYVLGAVLGVYTTWAFIRAIIILASHERHHIEGCNG